MAQILIIEDETSLRRLLKDALEGEGHHVLEAPEGRKGILLQKESPSDIIITDILMPGQEGLETIMELRRQFPTAKIIAMSGGRLDLNFDLLDTACKLGAVASLAKPFSLVELLAAVRSAQGLH